MPCTIIVARCDGCGASAAGSSLFGKSPLAHDCRQRQDRAALVEAAAAVFRQEGLDVSWIIWGGEAAENVFLSDLVTVSSVLIIDTAEYLKSMSAEISNLGWAGVIPPDFESLPLPPVVVTPDASDEFKLATAIGLALAYSHGAPELRDVAANTDTTSTYIERSTGSSMMYRCGQQDCVIARPFTLAMHQCEDSNGDRFPPTKRRKTAEGGSTKGNTYRNSSKMVPVRSLHFHEMPPRVRSWAWASFVSATNPLNVTASFFPGNPGPLPTRPIISPGFGPTDVQRQSNAPAPSNRKGKRSDKAGKGNLDGDSGPSGSTTSAASSSTGAGKGKGKGKAKAKAAGR
ncbi:MAG: hypothetical protein E7H89_11190 [Cutibacterium acnes]|nr:hypothetical protein [Cutibacterium acnes]